MENQYSNYDLLDKMIANNKKAKYWTAFWMVALSIMALAVLWLASTVIEKNNQIDLQSEVIKSNNDVLIMKSRIIDSLTKNCNDAKTAIIKDYDSVITQTQVAIDIVNDEAAGGSTGTYTIAQKEQIKQVNTSIAKIKSSIRQVKAEIKKENTRLFIQYNNPENKPEIERLLNTLKTNREFEYVVAPPEYINNRFPTVIKFYNYKNEKEEALMKKLVSAFINIPHEDILVKYEENVKIKPTVEIWLGTRQEPLRPINLKKAN